MELLHGYNMSCLQCIDIEYFAYKHSFRLITFCNGSGQTVEEPEQTAHLRLTIAPIVVKLHFSNDKIIASISDIQKFR